MDMLTLSDTRRLEKLAQAAGRTSGEVFKYVLRDGFEATERAVILVSTRMRTRQCLAHADAMRKLDQFVAWQLLGARQR